MVLYFLYFFLDPHLMKISLAKLACFWVLSEMCDIIFMSEKTMRKIKELKSVLRKHKKGLKSKYGIEKIGIFGSYTRGEETRQSDVDILVEFNRPIGLDFVTLAEELETLLAVKVDLVSVNAVKPRMMKSIQEELVYV